MMNGTKLTSRNTDIKDILRRKDEYTFLTGNKKIMECFRFFFVLFLRGLRVPQKWKHISVKAEFLWTGNFEPLSDL